VAKEDTREDARAALAHLTTAGVTARMMEGERCVLASMRLQPAPFETLTGSMRIDQVMFSSVGRYRIKCLKPNALFQLPLIRIHDCRDTTALEARIRLAWKRHISDLADARDWLDGLGARAETVDSGTALAFPIEGENRAARVRVIEPRRVAIPSLGPLTGITLQRPEDRTLQIDRGVRSAVELEIAVSSRLDELLRLDRRLHDERRRTALNEPAEAAPQTLAIKRRVRVLLVGPRLIRDQPCIDSLTLRDYTVDTAATEQEALAVFDRCSPELVLVDSHLGRSDGTSLVLALRQVTGVEEMPVVIVDDVRREINRESARRVGAAGYLVHPVEIPRIAGQLERMIQEPRRRRYTRYGRRLPVELGDRSSPCTTTSLGRGGMFVATETSLTERTLQPCRIRLPDGEATIRCEAEVLYRRSGAGRSSGGYGVRFHHFADSDENRLIEYLRVIDQSATAATAS
jgi:DNA-binding response OmpR family regulator